PTPILRGGNNAPDTFTAGGGNGFRCCPIVAACVTPHAPGLTPAGEIAGGRSRHLCRRLLRRLTRCVRTAVLGDGYGRGGYFPGSSLPLPGARPAELVGSSSGVG